MMNLYAILDGAKTKTEGVLSDGAICSLVAILLVFVILFLIIGITSLIFKWLDMIDSRKGIQRVIPSSKPVTPVVEKSNQLVVDTNDEDLMAAILVATIDYRNEIKKDVKLVSVREVK